MVVDRKKIPLSIAAVVVVENKPGGERRRAGAGAASVRPYGAQWKAPAAPFIQAPIKRALQPPQLPAVSIATVVVVENKAGRERVKKE